MDPIPETPLDALLARMYKRHGTSLVLRPDTPAEITTRSGRVYDDLIPADRLTEMLAAVTPPNRWEELQQRGQTEFDLDTPEGIFRLTLWKEAGHVSAAVYDPKRGSAWPVGSPMPSRRTTSLVTFIGCGGLVLVILALLYSAIAPSVHDRRPTQSTAIHDIKQLTIAFILYSQDYDETYPGWVRNPDGRYAHNTWDEQISSQIKSNDVFRAPRQTGVKSPSDPHKQRVLTFALNGALIAPYNGVTGEVDWNAAPNTTDGHRTLLGPFSVANPAETIVLAQMATDAPPPTLPAGAVGARPASGVSSEKPSEEWLAALPDGDSAARSVIDISPRTWVSGGADVTDDWYNEMRPGFDRIRQNGVARDLYSGGGTYGFVDGHVKFMKLRDSVGIGQVNHGVPVTAANWFKPTNAYNMWNPAR